MSTIKHRRTSRHSQVFTALVHVDGEELWTTSLLIAEKFNKRHNIVLRAIRNIECPDEFSRCNFAPSTYTDDRGKERPMYRISESGFMLLAMGFTGEEAMHWKITFITAFQSMRKTLEHQANISNIQGID